MREGLRVTGVLLLCVSCKAVERSYPRAGQETAVASAQASDAAVAGPVAAADASQPAGEAVLSAEAGTSVVEAGRSSAEAGVARREAGVPRLVDAGAPGPRPGPLTPEAGVRKGEPVLVPAAPRLLGSGCFQDSDCGSGFCEIAALGVDLKICCARACRGTTPLCEPFTGARCCATDERGNPVFCGSIEKPPLAEQTEPAANGAECGVDGDCLSGFCELGGLGSNYNICCVAACNGLAPSCAPGGEACEPLSGGKRR